MMKLKPGMGIDLNLQPFWDSAQSVVIELSYKFSILEPPSLTQNVANTCTFKHTHSSNPSVAGWVLYPHCDLPSTPLIAYQVAPTPPASGSTSISPVL